MNNQKEEITKVDKKFVVWALAEVSYEWIDWTKIDSFDTLECAKNFGKRIGGCWGIRKNTEPRPSYIVSDKRWIDV